MSDFNFKMTVDEVARYLFTGLAIGWGHLLATDTTANAWFKGNQWVKEPIPGAVGVVFLLFVGYLAFHVYRSFVYAYLISTLRAWFRINPKHAYMSRLAQEAGIQFDARVAEAVRGVLVRTDLKEDYPETSRAITTSIHVAYCSSLVLLLCSLAHPSLLSIVFLVVLLTAFMSDSAFEQMDVRMLKRHEPVVIEALQRERGSNQLQGAGASPPSDAG